MLSAEVGHLVRPERSTSHRPEAIDTITASAFRCCLDHRRSFSASMPVDTTNSETIDCQWFGLVPRPTWPAVPRRPGRGEASPLITLLGGRSPAGRNPSPPAGPRARPLRLVPDGRPGGIGALVPAYLRAGPRGRPHLRDPPLADAGRPCSVRGPPPRTRELVALGIGHDHVVVPGIEVVPDEGGPEPGQHSTSAAWSSVYRSRCIWSLAVTGVRDSCSESRACAPRSTRKSSPCACDEGARSSAETRNW